MKSSQWHNSDTSASWNCDGNGKASAFDCFFQFSALFHIKNIFLFFALFPFIVFALSGWNAFNFSSCSFFLIFLMHLCSRCNFRKWKWKMRFTWYRWCFFFVVRSGREKMKIDITGIILIVGLYKKESCDDINKQKIGATVYWSN